MSNGSTAMSFWVHAIYIFICQRHRDGRSGIGAATPHAATDPTTPSSLPQ